MAKTLSKREKNARKREARRAAWKEVDNNVKAIAVMIVIMSMFAIYFFG